MWGFFFVKSGGSSGGVLSGGNGSLTTHVDTDGWPLDVFLAHDCRPAGWAELCLLR